MIIAEIRDGHVIETVGRELTDRDAHRVTRALRRDGIRIEPVTDPFGTVHLWAIRPTTTEQEVRALRAFGAVTDSRLAWHGAAS